MKRVLATINVEALPDFADPFIEFLTEHRCFKSFIENCYDNPGRTPTFQRYGSLNNFRRNVTPDNWLETCFRWAYTPQGHEYWEFLHHKWSNIVKKKGNVWAFANLNDGRPDILFRLMPVSFVSEVYDDLDQITEDYRRILAEHLRDI